MAAITSLVRSRGHIIGASRSHDLHEAILADQGAPADHSKISARRAGITMLVRLNSVGRTHPPNFIVDTNSVKSTIHTKHRTPRGYKGTNYRCLWTGLEATPAFCHLFHAVLLARETLPNNMVRTISDKMLVWLRQSLACMHVGWAGDRPTAGEQDSEYIFPAK